MKRKATHEKLLNSSKLTHTSTLSVARRGHLALCLLCNGVIPLHTFSKPHFVVEIISSRTRAQCGKEWLGIRKYQHFNPCLVFRTGRQASRGLCSSCST